MGSRIEVDQAGSTVYYKSDEPGVIHRDGGPAIIWDDGSEFWYQNGTAHREDGPSTTYAKGGGMFWSWKGLELPFKQWCIVSGKTPEDILVLKIKYGIPSV